MLYCGSVVGISGESREGAVLGTKGETVGVCLVKYIGFEVAAAAAALCADSTLSNADQEEEVGAEGHCKLGDAELLAAAPTECAELACRVPLCVDVGGSGPCKFGEEPFEEPLDELLPAVCGNELDVTFSGPLCALSLEGALHDCPKWPAEELASGLLGCSPNSSSSRSMGSGDRGLPIRVKRSLESAELSNDGKADALSGMRGDVEDKLLRGPSGACCCGCKGDIRSPLPMPCCIRAASRCTCAWISNCICWWSACNICWMNGLHTSQSMSGGTGVPVPLCPAKVLPA